MMELHRPVIRVVKRNSYTLFILSMFAFIWLTTYAVVSVGQSQPTQQQIAPPDGIDLLWSTAKYIPYDVSFDALLTFPDRYVGDMFVFSGDVVIAQPDPIFGGEPYVVVRISGDGFDAKLARVEQIQTGSGAHALDGDHITVLGQLTGYDYTSTAIIVRSLDVILR